jgi:hypothetical protein
VQAEIDDSNLLVSLQANLGGDAASSRELVIERVAPEGRRRLHVQGAYRVGRQRRALRNGVRRHREQRLLQVDGRGQRARRVVSQMISIFSGVIDFHHDIARGDRFRIVYEAGFRDGAFVRNGRVVAIELINRNTLYQALWYSPTDGEPAPTTRSTAAA